MLNKKRLFEVEIIYRGVVYAKDEKEARSLCNNVVSDAPCIDEKNVWPFDERRMPDQWDKFCIPFGSDDETIEEILKGGEERQ